MSISWRGDPLGLALLVSEHDDFIRMAVTLWAIWHARRKAIHEDIYQSPQATHQFIESFLHDLSLSEKPRATAAAKVHPPLAPRWIPPPQNQSKVNRTALLQRYLIEELWRLSAAPMQAFTSVPRRWFLRGLHTLAASKLWLVAKL
jgi:hypothetical protein